MKTMLCKHLKGPENCDEAFTADTFEGIADLSKNHAMEMMKKGDKAHIKKMEEMKEQMEKDPESAKRWYEEMKEEFDAMLHD